MRDFEIASVDIRNRHLHTGAPQHGRQRAAAATDHQHVPAFGLPQEAVHRVDIVGRADTTAVGDAVVVALFPKRNAAGGVVQLNDKTVALFPRLRLLGALSPASRP